MNRALSDCGLQMDLADRRGATRFSVAWPTRIRGLDRACLGFEEWGHLRNLSSGGALVRANRALQVGSQAELLIKVPWQGETWMKFLATVTRLEGDGARLGLGLKFATCRPQFLSKMSIS